MPEEERDDAAGPGEDGAPDDAAVEIPITGELDLHAFAPRDVASVVEEYLAACQERNILALRIVHGKRRGVQRAVVQRVTSAQVRVGDRVTGAIGHGLLVLVAVGREDGRDDVAFIARKIRDLRVFDGAACRRRDAIALPAERHSDWHVRHCPENAIRIAVIRRDRTETPDLLVSAGVFLRL